MMRRVLEIARRLQPTLLHTPAGSSKSVVARFVDYQLIAPHPIRHHLQGHASREKLSDMERMYWPSEGSLTERSGAITGTLHAVGRRSYRSASFKRHSYHHYILVIVWSFPLDHRSGSPSEWTLSVRGMNSPDSRKGMCRPSSQSPSSRKRFDVVSVGTNLFNAAPPDYPSKSHPAGDAPARDHPLAQRRRRHRR